MIFQLEGPWIQSYWIVTKEQGLYIYELDIHVAVLLILAWQYRGDFAAIRRL